VPPSLKYESDGGPGITDILKLLRGSDEPLSDQRSFLKANIVFWLMGATDGHAKNFSIFISPGGRFRMTPLYDVISAQPSVDSKQILWKQFRLAMAFGTKQHYQIRQIAPRHFFQTADRAGIGRQVIESVIQELLDGTVSAVESVVASLPADFPDEIASSIEAGIKGRLRLLEHREPVSEAK
jgi:serine/threonine-protein kinase HipA